MLVEECIIIKCFFSKKKKIVLEVLKTYINKSI